MNEQGNAPVGQSVEPVAKPDVSKDGDYVTLETHRRLLDEKKKAQAKLDELLTNEKASEDDDARERGDYEALLKARDEEITKERSRRIELEESFVQGRKLNAIIDALGGNVEPKWFKLIDVNEVRLNPESGEVDTLSVAKVAESLRKEFPEMIKTGARLPADAPKGNSAGTISRAEWMKLPYAKMREYKPEQVTD